MYDKDDSYGYDLVIWDSLPYILQENNNKYDLKEGDKVVNVTNLYSIEKRANWYASSNTKSIIKLIHVVDADIDMKTGSLPYGFRSSSINRNYIGKMSDDCHDYILDEINRRDRLNYEYEIISDNDESDYDEDIISSL